jgi:Spy/CpxP family protein refolding chaperone
MTVKVLKFVAPLMLAVATVAGAQRAGGPPGRRGGGPGMMRCMNTTDSLTDSQKAQVKTLGDAFVNAHQPQMDSLRAIMEAARTARQAGKTQDEIRTIMEAGAPINAELAPFRKQFGETVVTYLTPAQLAAGCVPPAPGGGPPGGRRGGPPSARPSGR